MSFGAAVSLLVIGGSLSFPAPSFATEPIEMQLWQGTPPGSEGAGAVKESIEERGTAGKPDRKVIGVIIPTGKPVATWHHRMRDWMQQRGLLDQ